MKTALTLALALTLTAAPAALASEASSLDSMQLSLASDRQATWLNAEAPATFQLAQMRTSTSKASAAARVDQKNPWIAAALNFFLMGAGYVYNGERVPLGAALTASSIGLTYTEMNLQKYDQTLYWTMFASVFLANTFLAMDAYQEAERLNNQ